MATIKKRIESLECVQQTDKEKELPIIIDDDNIGDDGLEALRLVTGRKVYRFSEAVELFV